MNILVIHQYFLEDDDGGGSRWNEIAKIWAEKGEKVSVLCGMMHANKQEKRREYKGIYFKKKIQGKVTVWRCHVSESYNKNFVGRLKGYLSFVLSSSWVGLFKLKEKFDVIIVTSPPLFVGLTAYLISKVKRIPFVFEIRDLWPESAIDTGILQNKFIIRSAFSFEKFIYKKAKLISVLTPAFRDSLIQNKNVSGKKIILIPNAADFALSEHLLQTFNVAQFRQDNDLQGKLVFTYVGAHGVSNHLTQLIEAAALLQDKPVIFQLIGDGMLKESLKDEVRLRGLTNIRFRDSVSKKEIFKYILASDAGMSILKKAETFKTIYSNKTFDYMSCKKPVLMAIDGISRKLIEDADAGLYVEPENTADYLKVVSYYLEHPEIMTQQGENGYQFAKKNFDRNVLAKKYFKLPKKDYTRYLKAHPLVQIIF